MAFLKLYLQERRSIGLWLSVFLNFEYLKLRNRKINANGLRSSKIVRRYYKARMKTNAIASEKYVSYLATFPRSVVLTAEIIFSKMR